jgi:NAD(P)-dependent dehydrogenase (short-subunit alcohol dehydrogenase family)
MLGHTPANRAALAESLAALDCRNPVDLLVVAADPRGNGQDVTGAMLPVAVLAEPMRRRGRGEIVLVGGLAGRPAMRDLEAAGRTATAFLAYGASLRRRLRMHGVAVVVVAPGRIALRAASWCGEPAVAEIAADRLAERLLLRRFGRRAVIAAPGPLTVALRLLRLAPSRLRNAFRDLRPPSVAAMREAADEAPLPGEPGVGD